MTLVIFSGASLAASDPRDGDAASSNGVDLVSETIPDVIALEHDPEFCVVRAAISGTESADPSEFFLDFVERVYEATNQWTQDLLLAGIDYVDYKSFHIVSVSDCSSVDGSIRTANEQFEREAFECGHSCSLFQVEYANVEDSPVARRFTPDSEFMQLVSPTPVRRFEYFAGRDQVQGCTVAFRVESLAENAIDSGAYEALMRAWLIYRMSIFDISVIDTEMFVLFNRQCDRKQALVNSLLRMTERVDPGITAKLGELALDPDIQALLYAQTYAPDRGSNSGPSPLE